ncbi:MAG TPA: MarR family transcriptional regulator [Thermomicrobiales bacterium]|jgi:DNA-binding MarR family transcriptional regulator|nr:MarR family transcriptional regulator [Thermomicrobiales bacterium]
MAMSNPVPDPANATEHGLGTLLRISYQVMMADGVEPALAAAGYGDIRSAHLPVIQALATNPAGLRATELATHARITKQSMGYLVDHLTAGGYVERLPDPSDQRAKVVCLTPRGLELSRTIRTAVRNVETSWAARVGSKHMQQLRTVLQELVASFQR